jgi:site-specific recombinase XerC
VRPVLRLVRGPRPDVDHHPASDVAAHIETLEESHSAPGVKQQLAAVRRLFDWLVTGQVVPMNPAAAVRGPKRWRV